VIHEKRVVTMNGKNRKLHTLKDVLLSPRTDYQGKLRYLVPLFYILISLLTYWICFSVYMYMSFQMFQLAIFIAFLLWLLWGLTIMMYKKQKESRKT
jgi:hypothetical protein